MSNQPENNQNGPENGQETTSGTGEPETVSSPADETTEPQEPTENEPETFSRAYVTELRQEAAKHRTNAKKSDELTRRLVSAYAEATGRLHDPRDLAYEDGLLDDDGYPDPAKINDAVNTLIADRPHLARIRPVGDVGQGSHHEQPAPGLAAFGEMLRGAAS